MSAHGSSADAREVRMAARALARAGLVGPYGHCSKRISPTELLVCAPRPMGTIPAGDPGMRVPIAGPLPEGVLGEVRVHQQIYARRPDVHAVCRVLPPHVMSMSVLGRPPRARHGFGAFFHPAPRYWDDPALMRSDAVAAGVAEALGESAGIVLRANGAVVVAQDLPRAVTLAWFLEDMCRIELAVASTREHAQAPLLSDEQARDRATWQGRVAERMWDHLTFGDEEAG